MVDTLALGASAERREGSSPFIRTKTMTAEFDPKLSELQQINANFDAENFDGATTYKDPRLHVAMHMVTAAANIVRYFEQLDHEGTVPSESEVDKSTADLLKNVLQLSELRGKQIGELYLARLVSLETRNHTPGSAERAINSVKET